MSHGSWTLPRKREEHGRPGRAETDPLARAMPMRDDNQCLHGRDAHAPLAFVSHTLSSHFRISEPESTPMSHGSWTPPRKREEHGRPGRAETDPLARAMPMRDDNQCLHGRDAHAPLAFVSHTLSSHFRISEPESTPMSHGSWTLPRKREEHGRPGRAETDPIASHTHPNQKDTRSQAGRPRHTVGRASRLTSTNTRPQTGRPRHPVGQASRLTSCNTRAQARRPRHPVGRASRLTSCNTRCRTSLQI